MSIAKPTLGYGFDVVLAIDPAVYEGSSPGDVFQMDAAARRHLTAAIEESLTTPEDVAAVELEPGYVRVRVDPSVGVAPKDLVDELYRAVDLFNSRHATAESDRLRIAADHVSVYDSLDATSVESFLERHTTTEFDGSAEPIYEYERAPGADGDFAYEYVVPIDTEAYEDDEQFGHSVADAPGFQWSAAGVLECFEMVVEMDRLWPSGVITRVAIPAPEYVVVHHTTGSVHSPVDFARTVWGALQSYNKHKPAIETPEDSRDRPSPPLELSKRVYIGGLPSADGGADAWIEANGLDEEDGEPRDPEPELDAEPDAGGSAWSIPNPFGGGD